MAKVGNGGKKKSSHAYSHRQKVRTVAASHRHGLEQTTRRNTHLPISLIILIENPRARDLIYIRIIQIYSKDSVAEAAMDVTELLGR